ncbi:MAG TPA: hypothetical protein VD865_09845 [Stenotrophomonas sp.]|nr:hypothetical protein [Stenotrophomonas sp.]
MRHPVSSARVLPLVALVVAASGCSWFHKDARGDYALPAESRPLEVPPDLNLPDTTGAMKVPALASASQPASAPTAAARQAASNSGFVVKGDRDAVFAAVGDALGGIEGVNIASRAQLLGSYDVSYEGADFLVRVVATEAGSYVSAVDPRGLPATAEAPVKLIAALKAKLGG